MRKQYPNGLRPIGEYVLEGTRMAVKFCMVRFCKR